MFLLNVSAKIAKLQEENNGLPKYSWPGGLPYFYFDARWYVLCFQCACENDDFAEDLEDFDVNEEEQLRCSHCESLIEVAYPGDELDDLEN